MGENVGPGGIPIGSLTPDTSENPNKKQSRDPRMPKRPHNAFFYFCQVNQFMFFISTQFTPFTFYFQKVFFKISSSSRSIAKQWRCKLS